MSRNHPAQAAGSVVLGSGLADLQHRLKFQEDLLA